MYKTDLILQMIRDFRAFASNYLQPKNVWKISCGLEVPSFINNLCPKMDHKPVSICFAIYFSLMSCLDSFVSNFKGC